MSADEVAEGLRRRADEADDEDARQDAPSGASEGPTTRESFVRVVGSLLTTAGVLGGLEALRGASQRPGAGEALGALYDVVAETPALAWLLEPQGETLQRAFVIGAWLVPLAVDVRAEVLRKRIIEGEAADVNDAGGDGGFAAAPSTANGARRHGTTATPPADRRAHDAAL